MLLLEDLHAMHPPPPPLFFPGAADRLLCRPLDIAILHGGRVVQKGAGAGRAVAAGSPIGDGAAHAIPADHCHRVPLTAGGGGCAGAAGERIGDKTGCGWCEGGVNELGWG
eukprot:scaffold1148_cov108-Isochrysis_galbana.AAC.10